MKPYKITKIEKLFTAKKLSNFKLNPLEIRGKVRNSPRVFTMSGFQKSGENGKKLNHHFTTPEHHGIFFEKTNVNYDAKEGEFEGDAFKNGRKVFESVNRGEYGKRSDFKSRTREIKGKKIYIHKKEIVSLSV